MPLALRLLGKTGLDRALWRAGDRWRLRRGAGGAPTFPFVARRRDPSFQIFIYHRVNDRSARFFPGVPVERFRRHMEILARHATVFPLGELVARAKSGSVPPRSAAVTFDDGYRDNYQHAFPILRNLGLPATIFLATGAIETGTLLWHDRVFDAFEQAGDRPLTIAGKTLPMSPFAARRASLSELLALLRAQSREERETLVGNVESQIGGDAAPDAAERMLSWRQVQEMAGAGIDFGAHTVSHPILARLSGPERAAEIRNSREAIERRLNRPVDLFAYPNGTRADFDDGVERELAAQGFRAAVTTLWGSNDARTNPFALRRMGFWDADSDVAPLRLAWYRFSS